MNGIVEAIESTNTVGRYKLNTIPVTLGHFGGRGFFYACRSGNWQERGTRMRAVGGDPASSLLVPH